MKKLNRKNYIDLLIFFVLGILIRLPFLEKMQSHWDGPQYSIGVVRYSLENHTPAPPGYPIYIGFGKFANIFIQDPHLSILTISLIGGGIGCAFFYLLGLKFFNRTVGIIASFLFLTGPTFFYFAITANPYGLLPITAGILALIVLQIKRKNNHGILLGLAYAISVGIRPQDGLFLTPLFLYGLLLCDRKNKIYTVVSFTLGILIWMLPLFSAASGARNYFELLKNYQETALSNPSLSYLFKVWFILIKGAFLSFTISCIFLIIYLFDFIKFITNKTGNKIKYIFDSDYIILFSLWIFPSLLFNAFVRSDHAAHQMTYLSAFLILISYSIWRTFKSNMNFLWIIVAVITLFNLFTFFRDRDPGMVNAYVPQSYHYSEIKKNDIRMKVKTDLILSRHNPEDVLIITSEEMFRPYSYYLKDYSLVALNALKNSDLPYSNMVHHGKNWDLISYSSNNRILDIPQNTKKIIFLDDEVASWLKNKSQINILLSKNSSITEIDRKNFKKIFYDFNSIELK